ncbi:Probable RNA polymerase sigma factor fecI [Achromobacter xylosoxidans]|uniref:sigma-70 family RNA polymerase sigma factor n=1 Tax=Alcaligenes xylosoxydans xylosoxydans TaxID=85698 RepID=UPI0006C01313|nr:sigma-70 family RNA polymerase sigma factor [Achromobacter xylosoxidans]CUJ08503.1 Probable RNA polymerase sigma factor fecI [Achromobacter xylosoxidans]CUK16815.1 Probable RNA polymerase sigma factor fecI [Achromobacter xylosoxidans]
MKKCLATTACQVGGLYREHRGWLRNWIRGKVRRAEDADDLLQDTFVRVLCAAPPLHPGPTSLREPRAYLTAVAARLVANFYRRQALEIAYLEVLATLPPQQVPSAETQALVREALFEFDRMLDGLNPKVRQALVLSQFQGLPYAEIAARLDVSLRTVKNYIAQAMAHCCLAAF